MFLRVAITFVNIEIKRSAVGEGNPIGILGLAAIAFGDGGTDFVKHGVQNS